MSSPPVVLVTGCSKGGIGYALCQEFATRGCKVYATARSVEKLSGLPAGVETLQLDVTNDDDVRIAFKRIIDDVGKIDVVVNNAGGLSVGPVLDTPMQQVQEAFDLNTFSALRVAQAAFPHMAARKSGLIVNVGSVAGNVGTPWNGLYCASKSALHMLTDILDMECRPFNIHVMLVAPGGVRSNISVNQAATLSLPKDTLYKAFMPNIVARVYASQTPMSMPAEEFARKVVEAALKKVPTKYLSIGENSWTFACIRWLPRALILLLMWRKFSQPLKT